MAKHDQQIIQALFIVCFCVCGCGHKTSDTSREDSSGAGGEAGEAGDPSGDAGSAGVSGNGGDGGAGDIMTGGDAGNANVTGGSIGSSGGGDMDGSGGHAGNAGADACAETCDPPNAEGMCTDGVCLIASCDAGYEDCNADSSDGCETDLENDARNCGACGGVCQGVVHGTAACVDGSCTFVCTAGYEDCNADSSDGCEISLVSNESNCGVCENVCVSGEECVDGICSCLGSVPTICADACVDIAVDASNCGACGDVCSGLCANSACTLPEHIVIGEGMPYAILPDQTLVALFGASQRRVPDIAQAALGRNYYCVLSTAGAVSCTGHNSIGQLGDPSVTEDSVSTFVPVLGLDSGVIQIAVGESHACALHSDGTVTCWGRNDYGQLGNGTTVPGTTPTKVVGLANVTQIAVGLNSCALINDGSVQCWGWNYHGMNGDVEANRLTPAAVTDVSGVAQIAMGISALSVCVLKDNGRVVCWGSNTTGELGTGTSMDMCATCRDPVVGITTAQFITMSSNHVCALLADGTVTCWGGNLEGPETCDYCMIPTWSTEPIAVSGLNDVIEVVAGSFGNWPGRTCALRSDHTVWCWGDFGSAAGEYPTPILIPGTDGP